MEHDTTWPLYRRLPEEHVSWEVAELIEFLQACRPDAPIWLVNYRQLRNITQRPLDGMAGAVGPEGVLLW
jgi:hypothetical protein